MAKKTGSLKTTIYLVLIKPSKYDREGYVIQYRLGILPSNTLAVLYGLSMDLVAGKKLNQDVRLKVEVIDETVQKINFEKVERISRRANVRTLVCLCGVQSNQFPRAMDIACRFRNSGLSVAIGGFHVSGQMALFTELQPELAEAVARGITLVAGEVDETFGEILNDFLSGELKTLYNFLDRRPQLTYAPLPLLPRRNQKRYVIPTMATMDCGRGCPFQCSFCCVINVQGRQMRYRDPAHLRTAFLTNYYKNKIKSYLFTDDNFARNKNWEQILDLLIELREKKGLKLSFMMQIDTQSYKIPRFISKASLAGCTQAFIGVESLNPDNLGDVGKLQNKVEHYRELNDQLRQHHIVPHAAYILGFPRDTEESLKRDIQKLLETGFGQASFFIMTPLPGSEDYKKLTEAGVPRDPDLNNYDSFAPVMDHPLLSREKLQELYHYAWDSFQSLDNIKLILSRTPAESYYKLLGNFIWYRYSIYIDHTHPMISGFLPIRNRKTKRPGTPLESYWTFQSRKWKHGWTNIRLYLRFIREFEEIWLQTRPRQESEINVITELKKLRAGIRDRIHFADLLQAYQQAKLARPSRFKYFLGKIFFPTNQKFLYTRMHLNHYWEQAKQKLKSGKIFSINLLKIVYNFFYELGLLISLLGEFLMIKIKRGFSMIGNDKKNPL